MKVIEPDFGPLIGHTTQTTVRLWAALKADKSFPRVIDSGLVRIKEKTSSNDSPWQGPYRFRFNRNFYYTGVIEIQDLKPNTQYEYQLGYLKEPNGDDSNLAWHGTSSVFRTARSIDENDTFSFALGSCLYPKKSFIFGDEYSKDSRIDKSFKHVSNWADESLDLLLLMGDQVYADTGEFLDPAQSEKDYVEKYHGLYGSPNFAKAVRKVPTYMLMDDHEVSNDFTDGIEDYVKTDATTPVKRFFRRSSQKRLVNALSTFYAFETSHGPVFDKVLKKGSIAYIKGHKDFDVPLSHYYTLDYGRVGFFVMDTRLERSESRIVSKQQLKALIKWLEKSPAQIKFVVSGVTVLADKKGSIFHKPDNWQLATGQRYKLLKRIVKKNIKNVFFLSGDIHASFGASATYRGKRYPMHQIASSALFWPIGIMGSAIRWQRGDVKWNDSIDGARKFTLKKPKSDTAIDYYPGNGVGKIEVSKDTVTFTVTPRHAENSNKPVLKRRFKIVS